MDMKTIKEALIKTTFPYLEFSTGGIFNKVVGDVRGKKILSIGGGVDYVALALAERGAFVISQEISKNLCEETIKIATEKDLLDNITVENKDCYSNIYKDMFDMIISIKAIHHMNIELMVPKLYDALKEGGTFIGFEPLCLSSILRVIHKNIPFHPLYDLVSVDIELGYPELKIFKHNFSDISCYYFDCFTRTSIAYMCLVLNIDRFFNILKRIDLVFTKIPLMKKLASQVLIVVKK